VGGCCSHCSFLPKILYDRQVYLPATASNMQSASTANSTTSDMAKLLAQRRARRTMQHSGQTVNNNGETSGNPNSSSHRIARPSNDTSTPSDSSDTSSSRNTDSLSSTSTAPTDDHVPHRDALTTATTSNSQPPTANR
jgi:hypothetical protein